MYSDSDSRSEDLFMDQHCEDSEAHVDQGDISQDDSMARDDNSQVNADTPGPGLERETMGPLDTWTVDQVHLFIAQGISEEIADRFSGTKIHIRMYFPLYVRTYSTSCYLVSADDGKLYSSI